MATITFIGLGNMGGPMAANLVKAGHDLTVFDLSSEAVKALTSEGAKSAATIQEAVEGAEVVISMLPAGQHVEAVYLGDNGLLKNLPSTTLVIDSSTIAPETAKGVAEAAVAAGITFMDAPVSGGVGGAKAGTLTFICGGEADAFERAKPILEGMGKNIFHAGPHGSGQVAKICNNMVLGVNMIAVSEAFMLAKRLGLDAQKLFDVSSKASGQCWALTSYCPVPGPVPTSPANRDYQPGFAVDMMLKDLKLAQQASAASGATTPMGALAESLYALYSNGGNGGMDFSAIVKMLDGEK